MQGESFEADLRLLKLGGCDMVLGVDWMREVSPICFDFNKLEVTFEKGGRKMTLTGKVDSGICKIISGKQLNKLFKSKCTQVAQLFSIHALEGGDDSMGAGPYSRNAEEATPTTWEVTQLDILNELLVEFEDLFEEPNSLPPPRSIDHTIALKPGSDPVNIRSYQ